MEHAAVVLFDSHRLPSREVVRHVQNYTRMPVHAVTSADLRYTQPMRSLYHHLRTQASGPGKIYVHKILFAWTLGHLARRLVVLDSDIVIRSRIDSLAEISVSGIGLALEQASWYRSIMNGRAFNGECRYIRSTGL